MVLSLPYAQITGPSSGSRSFVMVKACWPGGICFSGSSLSPSNTVRGLSTLMPMASPVSVASVSGRIVRWDRRISSLLKPILPRLWRNNLSPRQQWGIQWIQTCFRSYPAKRGWPRSTWLRPPVTCLLLCLLRIKLGQLSGPGYVPVRLRFGRTELGCPQDSVCGISSLEIYP